MTLRQLTVEDLNPDATGESTGSVECTISVRCDAKGCGELGKPAGRLKGTDSESRTKYYEELAEDLNNQGWRVIDETRQVLCPKHAKQAKSTGVCP